MARHTNPSTCILARLQSFDPGVVKILTDLTCALAEPRPTTTTTTGLAFLIGATFTTSGGRRVGKHSRAGFFCEHLNEVPKIEPGHVFCAQSQRLRSTCFSNNINMRVYL